MTGIPLHPLVWLALSALCFAGGEYLSKVYIINPRLGTLVVLVASYCSGVFLWLPALRQRPELAVTGTIWSVVTMLMTVAIGVFIFGEALSTTRVIGIVLAMIAVALLSLP
jgi:multidrug transporter EmrE-like cation transporter